MIAQIKDDVKQAELLAEVLAQRLSKHQIEQQFTTHKTKPDLPAEAINLERELSRLMGAKVRLTGTDHGELWVKFSSIEELNRLLQIVGYEQ